MIVTEPLVTEVDLDHAELAAREMFAALGIEAFTRPDAPRRMVEALAGLLSPEPFTATTFDNEHDYNELVVARDIPFRSLCDTHLLPFTGAAHVGYVAGERIIGLSKLARAVDATARRLRGPARMTSEILTWLATTLEPVGAGVVVDADVKCCDSRTTTSQFSGTLLVDEHARQEFLMRAR